MTHLPRSVPGVARVELLRGENAGDAAPDLLVEVPHGAERRADYDALRARLVGDLPDDLHVFFHVNTDVGAWAYGRRVAELLLEARPHRAALLVRSEIPRTFVDCNRLADSVSGDLTKGGVTAGLAPYVRHPDDRALLLDLHRQYVEIAQQAYAAVCHGGGFALLPHTYGPVTLGIPHVDDAIVTNLREAHAPGVYETWPVRPEVDLLTVDVEGREIVAPGLTARLVEELATVGVTAVVGETYKLHPSTLGYVWGARYPGRTLSLEIRRDLLVERWEPFEEMTVDPAKVERLARPIAAAIASVW